MNSPMTPRSRMLAAYEGHAADTTPVAPEFWYYIPARLLGIPMYTMELEIPHWQALKHTFRHYQCEGWGIVAPGLPFKTQSERRWLDSDRLEENIYLGPLRSRRILDRLEPSWLVERYIKDFDRDWPVYEDYCFIPVDELDWNSVQSALDEVGEDYLLEVYLGDPFVDFAGGQREGGLEQVIQDITDRRSDMERLHERYMEYMAAKTRAVFCHTNARSIFVASIWSSISLLSPAFWRKWDKPVLEVIVQVAHECGGLVHHHFHGRCSRVLPELVALGLDCICPFERPPGGDVTDLREVVNLLDNRVTFNGNVHTVTTLIQGTPADVRREVLEILEAFDGSPRLIVGTGDQVGYETPDENIFSMIETTRQFGQR
jgi:PAS domain-containing protein